MNVGTLKALLEGHDDDERVRVAYQPNWPLAAEVASVSSLAELGCDDDDEDHHYDERDTVWIVAGDAPTDDPYAPRAVFTTW